MDDQFLVRFLEAVLQGMPREERIFPQGKATFGTKWDWICKAYDIEPRDTRAGAVPATMRGSAATLLFQNTESIPITLWRGGWQRVQTLEYYLQETGGQTLLANLSPGSRSKVRDGASAAPELLLAATSYVASVRGVSLPTLRQGREEVGANAQPWLPSQVYRRRRRP